MFDDMFIPWTSRFHRRKPETPPAPPPAEPELKPQICTRTLHLSRALIAKAVEPFPEVARAISTVFIAYIRGNVKIDFSADPASWTVI